MAWTPFGYKVSATDHCPLKKDVWKPQIVQVDVMEEHSTKKLAMVTRVVFIATGKSLATKPRDSSAPPPTNWIPRVRIEIAVGDVVSAWEGPLPWYVIDAIMIRDKKDVRLHLQAVPDSWVLDINKVPKGAKLGPAPDKRKSVQTGSVPFVERMTTRPDLLTCCWKDFCGLDPVQSVVASSSALAEQMKLRTLRQDNERKKAARRAKSGTKQRPIDADKDASPDDEDDEDDDSQSRLHRTKKRSAQAALADKNKVPAKKQHAAEPSPSSPLLGASPPPPPRTPPDTEVAALAGGSDSETEDEKKRREHRRSSGSGREEEQKKKTPKTKHHDDLMNLSQLAVHGRSRRKGELDEGTLVGGGSVSYSLAPQFVRQVLGPVMEPLIGAIESAQEANMAANREWRADLKDVIERHAKEVEKKDTLAAAAMEKKDAQITSVTQQLGSAVEKLGDVAKQFLTTQEKLVEAWNGQMGKKDEHMIKVIEAIKK